MKSLPFWTSFTAFKNQVPLFFFGILHFAVQDNRSTRTFYGHDMPLNRTNLKDSMGTAPFISILLSKIRAFQKPILGKSDSS